MVMELSDGLVEAVVLLEYRVRQPDLAVGIEQLTVQVVGDTATVLHLAHHVLDGIP